MPRDTFTVDLLNERFHFFYDEPGVLHITKSHGTTPADAIRAFYFAETTAWNEERRRYETRSATHGLYWTRHEYDGSVLIISCWERSDKDEQETN